MNDKLRERIEAAIKRWASPANQAQAVIEELNLGVVGTVRQHGMGSALEPMETEEEYWYRVRPQTIFHVEGSFSE